MRDDVLEARRRQKQAQEDVDKYLRALQMAEAEVKNIENNCHHQWGKINEEYRTEIKYDDYPTGEWEKNMGVDARPIYKTIKRDVHIPIYTRCCILCGKVEKTEKTEEVKTYRPQF